MEEKESKKERMKKDEVFYENGHALVWCEFKERGCLLTEKQAEKNYFLTKEEILRIAKKIKKEERCLLKFIL